jgi:nitrogen regulatory protein PII
MILKKYKGFPNHHEYLRDTLGSKSENVYVERRTIYLYVQDADIAGAVTRIKKMKK